MKNMVTRGIEILNKDIVLIGGLAACFMLYGLNDLLSALLVVVIFVLLLVNVNNNKLFYAYFACIFFEPILVLPFVGGTFFRLFYVLVIIRFVIDIVKKAQVKLDIPTLMLAAVFLVTSVLYSVSLSRNISVVANVMVVLYMVLTLRKQENYAKSIGELLTYIAVFAALSGVYGLSRGFIHEADAYRRLFGTIDDPNYSAMFYTIGFFASIGATLINKKWLKTALSVLLALLIISTASVTGIAIVALLILIYVFVTAGFKKGMLLLLVLAILVAMVLFVPVPQESILSTTQNKVQRFLVFSNSETWYRYQYPNYTEFEFYLNRITSNRYYLSKTYAIHFFYNTPISEQIFGGNNPIEGSFREIVPVRDNMASHNTYLDMLFMMGYVGFALVLVLVGYKLVRHFVLYLKTKDKRMLCLVLVMLTVLLFSAAISTFPFRYAIAFVLI